VAEWAAKVGHDEPIAYVFEKGALGKGEVEQFASEIMNDPIRTQRYRLGSLIFQPKKCYIPLQAADILANVAYKEICHGVWGDRTVLREGPFMELLGGMSFDPRYVRLFFDKRQLLPRKVSSALL
jgi:hypothetical protein